ncbi:hypothetical protein [Streptomyces sp. NPDC048192]|uniref:hypothetical protein n=1 Tax=Streptomyces sp. NPDC048192 TaxID=3365510 RepID=UPI00371F7C51
MTSKATELASAAHLSLWNAPWTVRPHPEPQGRQHPWLWSCTTARCVFSGVGVSEPDAHQQAADHHLRAHDEHQGRA